MKKKCIYTALRLLYSVPDRIMLGFQYFLRIKRFPHIKHPKRFTECILWYKTYYRNPEMLECCDKYHVREYVEKRLGKNTDVLNTLYQVHKKASQINFDELPEKFVIKTTDGGNGDNVFVCKNKDSIDKQFVIELVDSWKNKHYEKLGREWAYSGAIDSKVIVEQYLSTPENKDGSLDDYKFLCFNGTFKYLWVDKNRYSLHKRGFWNHNLEFLEGVRSDHPTFDVPPELPENIQDMIRIAEKLSSGFLFARVDMYNIKGHIYFGEITFYPWGGYVQFTPDEFDYEFGKPFLDCMYSVPKEYIKK